VQGSLRVLIVDDQSSMRSMLKKMLHQMGFCQAIEDAGDGEEAWEKLKRVSFDLVISDIGMPRLDGIGLLKRCRADIELRDLPFLMVSGHALPEWVAMASEWGAYDYIIKPFSYSFLKERIESLFERRNSPEEALYREIEHLKSDGRIEEALERIHELDKAAPLRLKWLNLKGECLMELGRMEEAAASIEKALELSDGFLAAHKNYAAIQQQLGNVEKAIEALEKADSLSPLDLDRKISLGNLMLQAGLQEDGNKFLEQALRQAPAEEKENYRSRIADIYMANKHYGQAENLYVKVVKTNPAAIEAFNRLGIALRRQGKLKEAEKYYQLALKSHPHNAAICYNLAVLYLNRAEKVEAAKLLKKVLEIDPTFKKAADMLREMEKKEEE
jgi:DNA-binding response OmpR family regulator/Tfp pilus assembly protein PilF